MSKEKEEQIDDVFGEIDFGESVDISLETGILETELSSDPIREEDMLPFHKEEKPKVKDTKKPAKEEVDDEEPEEDLEEDDDKKTPSHKESQSNAGSSIALVFAKFQNERGVLSNFDEEELTRIVKEEGEEAGLEYLYDSEVEARVEEVKKMYEDDIKEYITLKDSGIDSSKALELVSAKTAFENITVDQLEDSEELRKKILVQDLKNNTRYSDEDIDEMVENWITTGKDVEKAKKALPNIKKFNEEKIKAEKQAIIDADKAAQKAQLESKAKLKEAIYNSKEILGQTINKVTQQKLEKFMTEPIGNSPDGRPINAIQAWFAKNPQQAQINLAYAIMTGLLDGKMTAVKEKVKSSVVKELHEGLKVKGAKLDGIFSGENEDDGSLSTLKNTFKF
jgi:hypothetical protein